MSVFVNCTRKNQKVHDLANIRSKGKLTRWLDGKGFGFISPEKGKQEIFIHISAFDRNIPRRPKAGDTIFYYTQEDKNGKTKAVDAIIEGVTPISQKIPSRTKTYKREHTSKSSGRFLVFSTILVIGLGSTIYNKFLANKGQWIRDISELSSAFNTPQEATQVSSRYTCAGKIHCSEMNSCEEAKFYLQNCPGTKMDGDGDGIPCERQYCN